MGPDFEPQNIVNDIDITNSPDGTIHHRSKIWGKSGPRMGTEPEKCKGCGNTTYMECGYCPDCQGSKLVDRINLPIYGPKRRRDY